MRTIEYTDSMTIFEGAFYRATDRNKKIPCLMIAHAWDGLNDYFKNMASEFARRGLNAFAIDLYGKGVRGVIDGDNSYLMNPLLDNRALLHQRLMASFEVAKALDGVDENQIYILGFCFGGLCALDLARINPKGLKKIAAVHSLLSAPKDIKLSDKINAEVLLLHGWKDPMAPPVAFCEFSNEMNEKDADWSVKIYGKAMHAFTMVGANFTNRGILYDKKAAEDALQTLYNFFEAI